jgi:hypothetical protein
MVMLVSVARARACDAPKSTFHDVVLKPGSRSAQLAAKLARTSDYGNHAGGWLAQRLFALDDAVEISGEIVKDPTCFAHEPDDDLSFFVVLSPGSRRKLAKYFEPPQKPPQAVEVEMVAALSDVRGPMTFNTWRPGSARPIEFATGDTPFRPIAEETDWAMLQAPEWKYVVIRGALVVDMGTGNRAGTGELEIHPAEQIRLLRNLPDHHQVR